MQAKDLAELIRQLPAGYQTVFNLHAVEGFSHVEIGKMLGINEGTSRSQYARARALLISWLKKTTVETKRNRMSDHEFEKQVHQKLQELKLRPSDAVWMEVEKNIRQHKRRRRFLWLWSAALLVTLTTSGIVLYHFSGESRSTLEMANVTPAASSVSSNPTNNTVSPNSTNTNSNNTGTQASPIQPDPENSIAPASIEPTDASQPVAPSASNTTNQPGTTPAAAPETTQANTGLYEKKPAIAVTSKGTQEQAGNRQSVPLQSGSNRPRLKAGAIGAASKREQSAIGNKEKVEENSYSLPTGREGRVESHHGTISCEIKRNN